MCESVQGMPSRFVRLIATAVARAGRIAVRAGKGMVVKKQRSISEKDLPFGEQNDLMRESNVLVEVADSVESLAAEQGIENLAAIILEIGELSSVVPHFLKEYYVIKKIRV